MTVRELMQAHNLKTQDQQDELMVKLALDREALLAALKALVKATHHADTPYEMGVFSGDQVVKDAEFAIYQAEAK